MRPPVSSRPRRVALAALFAALFAAILFVPAAHGQVPHLMTHQGLLLDGSGLPIPDGPHTITVAIHDATTGGTVLWTEDHVGAEVTDGRFHLVLGSVTPLDLPFDAPYWLEVALDGGAPLEPRLPLTAAPYSRATEAVFGATNVFPSDGDVGIGTGGTAAKAAAAPQAKLDVEGDLRIGDVPEAETPTRVLVQEDADQLVKFIPIDDLVGSFGLPFAGTVNLAQPAFKVTNNGGDAVAGTSSAPTGVGVLGQADDYIGVYGVTQTGWGLYGTSTRGVGVRGESDSGTALEGSSNTGRGLSVAGFPAAAIFGTTQLRTDTDFGRPSRLFIEELEATTDDRFLIWSNDQFVRYKTLDLPTSDGTFDNVAVVILDDTGTETTRINPDGTSFHEGLETYRGGIDAELTTPATSVQVVGSDGSNALHVDNNLVSIGITGDPTPDNFTDDAFVVDRTTGSVFIEADEHTPGDAYDLVVRFPVTGEVRTLPPVFIPTGTDAAFTNRKVTFNDGLDVVCDAADPDCDAHFHTPVRYGGTCDGSNDCTVIDETGVELQGTAALTFPDGTTQTTAATGGTPFDGTLYDTAVTVLAADGTEIHRLDPDGTASVTAPAGESIALEVTPSSYQVAPFTGTFAPESYLTLHETGSGGDLFYNGRFTTRFTNPTHQVYWGPFDGASGLRVRATATDFGISTAPTEAGFFAPTTPHVRHDFSTVQFNLYNTRWQFGAANNVRVFAVDGSNVLQLDNNWISFGDSGDSTPSDPTDDVLRVNRGTGHVEVELDAHPPALPYQHVVRNTTTEELALVDVLFRPEDPSAAVTDREVIFGDDCPGVGCTRIDETGVELVGGAELTFADGTTQTTAATGGSFDGTLENTALVVKDAAGNETFRVDPDGTSVHEGHETFNGGASFPGTVDLGELFASGPVFFSCTDPANCLHVTGTQETTCGPTEGPCGEFTSFGGTSLRVNDTAEIEHAEIEHAEVGICDGIGTCTDIDDTGFDFDCDDTDPDCDARFDGPVKIGELCDGTDTCTDFDDDGLDMDCDDGNPDCAARFHDRVEIGEACDGTDTCAKFEDNGFDYTCNPGSTLCKAFLKARTEIGDCTAGDITCFEVVPQFGSVQISDQSGSPFWLTDASSRLTFTETLVVTDLTVNGTLSKPSGTFKIDHPLDPENKYLYHSFVESPDMMNVYNGNVTTDADGYAEVELPDYFETLNRDPRYQLTVIGTPGSGPGQAFAQAVVAEEIRGNRFVIRTNEPGVKVSWQVTGIRQDPWAEQNRIQVEVEKPTDERGMYLHPEVYGQPASRGIVPVREAADARPDNQ